MIPFEVGFYGWPMYILLCILVNYWNIVIRGKKPVYFASNQWRFFFGMVFTVIMSSEDGFNGIDFAYPGTMPPYIPHAVYVWTSFALFFSPGLNALRGKRWNYRGKSSGWIDKLKIVVYYTIKGVCLVGFIWSLTKLL